MRFRTRDIAGFGRLEDANIAMTRLPWRCVERRMILCEVGLRDEVLDASQKRLDPHHTNLYAVDLADSLARPTTPLKANPHCPTLAAFNLIQICIFGIDGNQ